MTGIKEDAKMTMKECRDAKKPSITKNPNKIVRENGVVKIDLCGRGFAIVDEADYPLVAKYRWHIRIKSKTKQYASSGGGNMPTLQMARVILNAPPGLEVDHIDNDGLNNRRSNIRLATHPQNMSNTKIREKNTTGFKGVKKRKGENRWIAEIGHNNKKIHIGRYGTPEEAYRAYVKKGKELKGEYFHG